MALQSWDYLKAWLSWASSVIRDANCEGEILLSRGAAADTADISRGSESTMRLQHTPGSWPDLHLSLTSWVSLCGCSNACLLLQAGLA